MFTQLQKERSNAGLGVGLPLIKSLVEMYGGRISIESAGTDRGTTVTVRLPVVVEQSDEPTGEEAEPAVADVEASELSGLRVLVVDDNKSTADMLGMALEHMACSIRVAYSAEAAINAAAESSPHVILMDIGMPRVDGYEAFSRK